METKRKTTNPTNQIKKQNIKVGFVRYARK